jgi:hypothetical protein
MAMLWSYYSAEGVDSGGAAEKKSVPLESDPRQRPRAFFPSEPLEEAAGNTYIQLEVYILRLESLTCFSTTPQISY